jgi:hypothetical protein
MSSLSNRGRVARNTACAVATPKIDGCRVASTYAQAPLDGSPEPLQAGFDPRLVPSGGGTERVQIRAKTRPFAPSGQANCEGRSVF